MSPEPFPEMEPVRASPSEARAGDTLELMRQQRRIGGDHNNDGAHVALRVSFPGGVEAGLEPSA